ARRAATRLRLTRRQVEGRRCGMVASWSRAFLIGLALVGAAAIGYAQGTQAVRPLLPGEKIVSGENIGFRIPSYKGKTPVGRIGVKVDDQWVDVEFAFGLRLSTGQ